jgi:hypothetical protein
VDGDQESRVSGPEQESSSKCSDRFAISPQDVVNPSEVKPTFPTGVAPRNLDRNLKRIPARAGGEMTIPLLSQLRQRSVHVGGTLAPEGEIFMLCERSWRVIAGTGEVSSTTCASVAAWLSRICGWPSASTYSSRFTLRDPIPITRLGSFLGPMYSEIRSCPSRSYIWIVGLPSVTASTSLGFPS